MKQKFTSKYDEVWQSHYRLQAIMLMNFYRLLSDQREIWWKLLIESIIMLMLIFTRKLIEDAFLSLNLIK